MQPLRRSPWILGAIVVGVGVAVALSLGVSGVVMLGGYAGLNAFGVLLYCEKLRRRRPTLQRVLQVLAVLLVPVGLLTVFLTPSGLTPSERSTSGSDDPDVRTGTAGASLPHTPSIGGGFGSA